MTKKPMVSWKQNHLEEAKTLGYMEGYSDGRLELIKELVKYKLLSKNWKKEYNKKTESNYLIK
jgi:flagellar biosynthesis/type III secretory pathway protein FliH